MEQILSEQNIAQPIQISRGKIDKRKEQKAFLSGELFFDYETKKLWIGGTKDQPRIPIPIGGLNSFIWQGLWKKNTLPDVKKDKVLPGYAYQATKVIEETPTTLRYEIDDILFYYVPEEHLQNPWSAENAELGCWGRLTQGAAQAWRVSFDPTALTDIPEAVELQSAVSALDRFKLSYGGKLSELGITSSLTGKDKNPLTQEAFIDLVKPLVQVGRFYLIDQDLNITSRYLKPEDKKINLYETLGIGVLNSVEDCWKDFWKVFKDGKQLDFLKEWIASEERIQIEVLGTSVEKIPMFGVEEPEYPIITWEEVGNDLTITIDTSKPTEETGENYYADLKTVVPGRILREVEMFPVPYTSNQVEGDCSSFPFSFSSLEYLKKLEKEEFTLYLRIVKECVFNDRFLNEGFCCYTELNVKKKQKKEEKIIAPPEESMVIVPGILWGRKDLTEVTFWKTDTNSGTIQVIFKKDLQAKIKNLSLNSFYFSLNLNFDLALNGAFFQKYFEVDKNNPSSYIFKESYSNFWNVLQFAQSAFQEENSPQRIIEVWYFGVPDDLLLLDNTIINNLKSLDVTEDIYLDLQYFLKWKMLDPNTVSISWPTFKTDGKPISFDTNNAHWFDVSTGKKIPGKNLSLDLSTHPAKLSWRTDILDIPMEFRKETKIQNIWEVSTKNHTLSPPVDPNLFIKPYFVGKDIAFKTSFPPEQALVHRIRSKEDIEAYFFTFEEFFSKLKEEEQDLNSLKFRVKYNLEGWIATCVVDLVAQKTQKPLLYCVSPKKILGVNNIFLKSTPTTKTYTHEECSKLFQGKWEASRDGQEYIFYYLNNLKGTKILKVVWNATSSVFLSEQEVKDLLKVFPQATNPSTPQIIQEASLEYFYLEDVQAQGPNLELIFYEKIKKIDSENNTLAGSLYEQTEVLQLDEAATLLRNKNTYEKFKVVQILDESKAKPENIPETLTEYLKGTFDFVYARKGDLLHCKYLVPDGYKRGNQYEIDKNLDKVEDKYKHIEIISTGSPLTTNLFYKSPGRPTAQSQEHYEEEDEKIGTVKDALDTLFKTKADLDNQQRVMIHQLPSFIFDGLHYMGLWDNKLSTDVFTPPSLTLAQSMHPNIHSGFFWIWTGLNFVYTDEMGYEKIIRAGDYLIYNESATGALSTIPGWEVYHKSDQVEANFGIITPDKPSEIMRGVVGFFDKRRTTGTLEVKVTHNGEVIRVETPNAMLTESETTEKGRLYKEKEAGTKEFEPSTLVETDTKLTVEKDLELTDSEGNKALVKAGKAKDPTTNKDVQVEMPKESGTLITDNYYHDQQNASINPTDGFIPKKRKDSATFEDSLIFETGEEKGLGIAVSRSASGEVLASAVLEVSLIEKKNVKQQIPNHDGVLLNSRSVLDGYFWGEDRVVKTTDANCENLDPTLLP